MRVTGWYCDPDEMELGMAVPIVEIILLVLASLQLLRQMGKTEAEIATMVANHRLATPERFSVYRFRNTVVYGVIGTLLGLLATIRARRSPPTRST